MFMGPDDIFRSLTLGITNRKIPEKTISGCSRFASSPDFRKEMESVRSSDYHKKKQEACFDLLCLWVPRRDKSYHRDSFLENQISDI
jgi:hypothetical protein